MRQLKQRRYKLAPRPPPSSFLPRCSSCKAQWLYERQQRAETDITIIWLRVCTYVVRARTDNERRRCGKGIEIPESSSLYKIAVGCAMISSWRNSRDITDDMLPTTRKGVANGFYSRLTIETFNRVSWHFRCGKCARDHPTCIYVALLVNGY